MTSRKQKKVGVYPMRKVSFAALMLAAVLMVASMGLADDASLAAAQAMVPQGATLRETDVESNTIEYTFDDPATGDKYEVTISKATGNVTHVEQEAKGVHGGASATITQEQAQASVTAQWANAEILYASLKEDDRAFTWLVLFRDGDALGVQEINAESGAFKEQSVYYAGTAGEYDVLLTPAQAAEAIIAAHAGAEIQYMNLDEDNQRIQYEGKATVHGEVYEFEFNPYGSGSIVEFERD